MNLFIFFLFYYIIDIGDYMLDCVTVFGQNSIKFTIDKKIYIDPLQIDKDYHDADIIFITHDHYDHFSLDDIERVRQKDTILIAPKCMKDLLGSFSNVMLVEVGEKYRVLDIDFETVPSYNIDKPFHPKEKGYVGYILNLDGKRYYIAGDTDDIAEIRNISCDVCFIPIGGKFTMDWQEAVLLVEKIRPRVAVPVHYGSIVGSMEDGINFQKELESTDVQCVLMIK